MKNFFNFIKNKYFIIFFVFIIMSVFLISSANKKNNNSITNIIVYITAPLQKGFSQTSNKISFWFKTTFQGKKLIVQNQELQSEINELRKQLVDLNRYKIQNQDLLKILNINEYIPNLKIQPALVIGKTTNDPFKSFTIDKGSSNNIKIHDCVITPDGLVGYISKIQHSTSIVKTILDVDAAIGTYNSNNGESGILTGSIELAYKNLSKMKYLSRQSNAKPKDILITSGVGNNFPKGILIGEIVSLKQEPYNTSYFAIVKPFCNFKNIKNVFVITSFSSQSTTYSSWPTIGQSSLNLGSSN